jgi:hypothetical protein
VEKPLKKEDLQQIWAEKQEVARELPFSITIFPIPGIGINTEAIRKMLASYFNRKEYTEDTKVLSVQECTKQILSSELKKGDKVWISALSSEVIPSRVIFYPANSPKEKFIELSVGKGSAAFSRSIGYDFFSGQPCYHMYLTEIDWEKAFFLRLYFPSTTMGIEHLKLINNCGIIAYGELDETTVSYPCIRTDNMKNRTIISEFTENCSIGIRAKILYRAKEWNILSYLETIDDKTSFQRTDNPQETSIYWLKGIPTSQ